MDFGLQKMLSVQKQTKSMAKCYRVTAYPWIQTKENKTYSICAKSFVLLRAPNLSIVLTGFELTDSEVVMNKISTSHFKLLLSAPTEWPVRSVKKHVVNIRTLTLTLASALCDH